MSGNTEGHQMPLLYREGLWGPSALNGAEPTIMKESRIFAGSFLSIPDTYATNDKLQKHCEGFTKYSQFGKPKDRAPIKTIAGPLMVQNFRSETCLDNPSDIMIFLGSL